MGQLSPEELRAILDKLDEMCRQAQELQQQIREKMAERARADHPAISRPHPVERRKRPRP